MKGQEKKLLFIGGAGHSGTTMLAKIFNKHPASIGVQGESRVVESLDHLQKAYIKLESKQEQLHFLEEHTFYGVRFKKKNYEYGKRKENPYKGLMRASDLSGDARKDYHSLILKALKENDKGFFIEKTPSNVHHAKETFSTCNNTRLLLITRDVMDVVASLKKRYLTLLKNPEVYKHNLATKKLDKDYNLVMDAIMWRKTVEASFKAFEYYGKKKVKILRYEDIVQRPENSVRDICNWFGITYQKEMLELHSRNTADHEQKNQKGISSSSMGNYKNTLNEVEIAVVEKYAMNGMELLDIKRNKQKTSTAKYELISYLKVLNRLRKRLLLMRPDYIKAFAKRFIKRI